LAGRLPTGYRVTDYALNRPCSSWSGKTYRNWGICLSQSIFTCTGQVAWQGFRI